MPDKGKLQSDDKRILYRFPRFEKKGSSPEPGFICFFRKGAAPEEFHTLSFEASSSKELELKIVIPCADWKHAEQIRFTLPAGKTFRQYRFLLRSRKNTYRPNCHLRGEILFQALRKESEGCELEIRNLILQ